MKLKGNSRSRRGNRASGPVYFAPPADARSRSFFPIEREYSYETSSVCFRRGRRRVGFRFRAERAGRYRPQCGRGHRYRDEGRSGRPRRRHGEGHAGRRAAFPARDQLRAHDPHRRRRRVEAGDAATAAGAVQAVPAADDAHLRRVARAARQPGREVLVQGRRRVGRRRARAVDGDDAGRQPVGRLSARQGRQRLEDLRHRHVGRVADPGLPGPVQEPARVGRDRRADRVSAEAQFADELTAAARSAVRMHGYMKGALGRSFSLRAVYVTRRRRASSGNRRRRRR
ncbi:hypothetical protein EMIT0111MI5_20330 [Burkholderia sp. IT-111MI5]